MAFLHTFSIVARDKETGELGVAVQTHWFAVGALCPWIEAGVGAVATQSMVEVSYGPASLDLLREGKTPQESLDILLAKDKDSALRQVAIIDNFGNTATHTGSRCIREAGHIQGDGFSVQANMMLNNTVWDAMAEKFRTSNGKLAQRLIATLKAAQKAGGDIRGMQSAALLVAQGKKSEEPWREVSINLRVDDHTNPIEELERLYLVNLAYEHMNKGDDFLSKGDFESAGTEYQHAFELSPSNEEIPFWHAVALLDAHQIELAAPILEKLFRQNPDWFELIKRLPESGLMKNDDQQLEKVEMIMRSINREKDS